MNNIKKGDKIEFKKIEDLSESCKKMLEKSEGRKTEYAKFVGKVLTVDTILKHNQDKSISFQIVEDEDEEFSFDNLILCAGLGYDTPRTKKHVFNSDLIARVITDEDKPKKTKTARTELAKFVDWLEEQEKLSCITDLYRKFKEEENE